MEDILVQVQALLLLIIVPARWRLRLLLAAPFRLVEDSVRFITSRHTLKVSPAPAARPLTTARRPGSPPFPRPTHTLARVES